MTLPDAREAFTEEFGAPATILVRAPGRVNLIGEHIDYCGLPVLPMAIEREIRVALRPRDDARIRIASASAGFAPRVFEMEPEIAPSPAGDWVNYVKAAAQALVGEDGPLGSGGPRRGLDGLVHSDLPVAAGLSSSSALVVACALAILMANGCDVDAADGPIGRRELADLLAEGERYVGLRGGGMDQAICLGAREGHAARIEFDPLGWAEIAVPEDWRFIVADSLVRAEKSGAAREVYNRRTEECRAALAQLADLVDPASRSASGGVTYRALLSGVPAVRLLEEAAGRLDSTLAARFRHVIGESVRVEAAVRALGSADLEAFGRLLQASHRSLRDDYEVSTAELDELVEIASESGAAGARLTGAGLGGCAIAVCDRDREPGVLAALEDRYYAARTVEPPLADQLFVARPSAAASVTRL